jgi:hypothetical protein
MNSGRRSSRAPFRWVLHSPLSTPFENFQASPTPDASTGAFSPSLTTTVFSQRSMGRFEASLRSGDFEGPTFIGHAAPHQQLHLHQATSTFRTHSCTHRVWGVVRFQGEPAPPRTPGSARARSAGSCAADPAAGHTRRPVARIPQRPHRVHLGNRPPPTPGSATVTSVRPSPVAIPRAWIRRRPAGPMNR